MVFSPGMSAAETMVNSCQGMAGSNFMEVMRPRGMLVVYGAASGQVPPFDIQRLNSGGSLFVTRPRLFDYNHCAIVEIAYALSRFLARFLDSNGHLLTRQDGGLHRVGSCALRD